MEIWNQLLFNPILNVLIWLYKMTGDLGLSIIALTVGLRLAMTPLTAPSLKVSKKMQDLAPELAKLKVKFKDDKQGMMTAQADLYKQHGINPAAGCLPQIIQIVVLIALFNSFNLLLTTKPEELVQKLNSHLWPAVKVVENFTLSTKFWLWDLTKPDVFKVNGLPFPLPGALLLLSAAVQLLSSKMMMPVVDKQLKAAAKTPEETDDVMASTQEQMLYMFPLMTILFGFQFPAGLVLYWFVFSGVSMIQQYFITGWGGLLPWINVLKSRGLWINAK